MKLSLDENILTKAFQYNYVVSPTRKFVFYSLALVFSIGVVIVIWLTIEEDVVERKSLTPWPFGLNQAAITGIGFCVTFLCVMVQIGLFTFRDVLSKRSVRKLLDKMGSVDLEINYSNEGIEIKDSKSVTRLDWNDYTKWIETEDLLLLYRRKTFFDVSERCDIIDLNQVSEEEETSFREILRTKVSPGRHRQGTQESVSSWEVPAVICGVSMLILVSLAVVLWLKCVAPIRGLKDKDAEVRRQAVESLEASWVSEPVMLLTVALKDADKGVRKAAARALGEIDEESAIEPLIGALRDRDEQVRASACAALCKIGEPALEPLTTELQDKDPSVRKHAAESLGLMLQQHFLLIERGPFAPYHRLVVPEPKLTQTAIEFLIEALKDENENVRAHAAGVLGSIGTNAKMAAPNLGEALKDEDEVVRTNAAGALGSIGTALQREKDTTAIPDLEMALAALRATNFSKQITRVYQAVEALKAIEKGR